MTKVTILKIAFSGKYMELWLEGIPFELETQTWCHETDELIPCSNVRWNFCTKPCYFHEWYNESYGEDALFDRLFWYGWKALISEECYISNGRLYFVKP